MFAARAFRATAARAPVAARAARPAGRRQMSYASFYDTYLKSNASMVTFIVAGAIVTELMFSKGTDALWSAANGGKLVEHVDWAKWSADDDEDDDDDDDD